MRVKHIVRYSLLVSALALPAGASALGLGRLTVESYVGQPLVARIDLLSATKEELDTLSAKIADQNLYRTGYFYLAVNAAVGLEDIRRLFPAVAKIGPSLKMREIVDSALPGVPLRHTPTPPPQLRVLPGFVYFELDRSVPEWREFNTSPALGLHVAGDWPQLKLELWCVKRAER